MKIILSRKGFDSAAGGYANPILPDGTLLSLPIPDKSSDIKYSELNYKNSNYYSIMNQLKGSYLKEDDKPSKLTIDTTCHLDPDLKEDVITRDSNWKGLFGQIDKAQSHLLNQKVEVGDLFLFFGWFRNTVMVDNKLQFDPNDKQGRHIIYGYFQIGDIIEANKDCKLKSWMKYHPHALESRLCREKNTIYVARDYLSFDSSIKGYGTLDFCNIRVLTKKGMNRSKWDLPSEFRDVSISYHKDESWKDEYFQSAARGQEFVMESNKISNLWAKMILKN